MVNTFRFYIVKENISKSSFTTGVLLKISSSTDLHSKYKKGLVRLSNWNLYIKNWLFYWNTDKPTKNPKPTQLKDDVFSKRVKQSHKKQNFKNKKQKLTVSNSIDTTISKIALISQPRKYEKKKNTQMN